MHNLREMNAEWFWNDFDFERMRHAQGDDLTKALEDVNYQHGRYYMGFNVVYVTLHFLLDEIAEWDESYEVELCDWINAVGWKEEFSLRWQEAGF